MTKTHDGLFSFWIVDLRLFGSTFDVHTLICLSHGSLPVAISRDVVSSVPTPTHALFASRPVAGSTHNRRGLAPISSGRGFWTVCVRECGYLCLVHRLPCISASDLRVTHQSFALLELIAWEKATREKIGRNVDIVKANSETYTAAPHPR